MQIFIDEQEVDFQFEHEKYLSDIIDFLGEWLADHSQVIQQIKVDGSPIENTQDNTFQRQSIYDVQKLELFTTNKYEFAIELLVELQSYIHNMRTVVESSSLDCKDIENKTQVIDGLCWIRGVIAQELNTFQIDSETVFCGASSLHDTLASLLALETELREKKFNDQLFQGLVSERLEALLQSVDPFLLKLSHRIMFLCSRENKQEDQTTIIKTNIQDILESLDEFSQRIQRISTYLQVGREIEAYLDIKNVLGLVKNLVLYLEMCKESLGVSYDEWVVEGKTVEEENKELNILIEKIYDVFVRKDNVLLGDLLEYELLDQLRRYKRIFQESIVMIQSI